MSAALCYAVTLVVETRQKINRFIRQLRGLRDTMPVATGLPAIGQRNKCSDRRYAMTLKIVVHPSHYSSSWKSEKSSCRLFVLSFCRSWLLNATRAEMAHTLQRCNRGLVLLIPHVHRNHVKNNLIKDIKNSNAIPLQNKCGLHRRFSFRATCPSQ